MMQNCCLWERLNISVWDYFLFGNFDLRGFIHSFWHVDILSGSAFCLAQNYNVFIHVKKKPVRFVLALQARNISRWKKYRSMLTCGYTSYVLFDTCYSTDVIKCACFIGALLCFQHYFSYDPLVNKPWLC